MHVCVMGKGDGRVEGGGDGKEKKRQLGVNTLLLRL